LILRSGRLPKKQSEIVVDQVAKTKYNYQLGDKFKFSKNSKLKQREYKIVGFASSPQYIDNSARGSSNVGDGTVRIFAYIPEDQMNMKTATLLNVRFAFLQDLNTYSNEYKNSVDKKVVKLKQQFKTRSKNRTKEIVAPAQDKITEQKQQLNTLQQMMPKQQFDEQMAKLKLAQNKLDKTKTTYTWQTRDDLPGFSAYGESSDRIAAIANVFPVFFFLIAALITFTTITRMIEEARGQIGTFKALGYSKVTIARNYIIYAFSAGIIGTILGAIIGNESIPRIVLALYKQYIPLDWDVQLSWLNIFLAIIFALLATVGAAVIVVRKELSEKPADLMRPKAPKSTKKILLERIKPFWNRLSFNRKVSYRNLFRFKSRMVMTIIGIAGGTALILTGFGIQNSIGASSENQYKNIFQYQAIVRLKNDNETAAKKVLENNSQYINSTAVNAQTGTVKNGNKQVNDINMYIPRSKREFANYIHLDEGLSNNGVVISQKTAQELQVKKNSKIKLTLTNGKTVQIKVIGITTNYVGHFIYMSVPYYQEIFNKYPKNNTLLVKLKKQTNKQRTDLADDLLNQGHVLGTSYTKDQQKTILKMASSLNPVILIFILLSGILSFVVLYNLTNINVSERIRELSTIKVLGFYNNEVTMYIVRENIILTVVGIIIGYGVGNLLTAYILRQAATEQIIFPLTIHLLGYVIATVLMILFTIIVMLVTHNKLKHIDMIGALKSNE
jgi:ABC-type transport system, involved in lipoprotein release, permease component